MVKIRKKMRIKQLLRKFTLKRTGKLEKRAPHPYEMPQRQTKSCITSFIYDIQQHPTTSNNIQQHPTTSNNIQQYNNSGYLFYKLC
jgi:hypothetical protein